MIRHIREGLRMAGVKPSQVAIVPGGRHMKITVDGRVVAVTPMNAKHPDKAARWLAMDLMRPHQSQCAAVTQEKGTPRRVPKPTQPTSEAASQVSNH